MELREGPSERERARKTELQGEGLEKGRGGNCIQPEMIYYCDHKKKVWILFPPSVERAQNSRPALGSQHKYFAGGRSGRWDLRIEKLCPGGAARGQTAALAPLEKG